MVQSLTFSGSCRLPYPAIFIVHSNLNYSNYVWGAFRQSRSDSRWFLSKELFSMENSIISFIPSLCSPHVAAYSYKKNVTTPILTYYWAFKIKSDSGFGWQLIVDLLSAPPSDAIYHFYWLEHPASAANVAYLVKIWNYSANFTHFAEVLWATDEVKIKHKFHEEQNYF